MKRLFRNLFFYQRQPITGERSFGISSLCIFRTSINYKKFYEYFYLFGVRVYKRPILERLNKRCLSAIFKTWPGYDIYIPLASGTGEVFILLSQIKRIFRERFKNKRIAFICRNEKLVSLVQAFNPDADVFLNPDFTVLFLPAWKETSLGSVWNPLNAKYFSVTEQKIIRRETTYFENLTKEIGPYSPSLLLHQLMDELKFHKTSRVFENFNFKNSIFLIPHAETLEDVSLKVWEEIVKKLIENGFTVYVNATSTQDRIPNAIPLMLSFVDAIYFGSRCEGIIGMRCGLMEIIFETSKLSCLAVYTNFGPATQNRLSAKEALFGFSMKHLPHNAHNDLVEVIYDGKKQILMSAVSSWASRITVRRRYKVHQIRR